MQGMRLSSSRALVLACASVLLALALPGSARPALPWNSFFGPKLVRAEVIVKNGVLHDYRIDRGRVRVVSATSVSLVERDGTLVTIRVAPNANVRLNGRRVALVALRRGMTATTLRDGDAPATTVRATTRFSAAWPRASAFFGPKLVRAEVIAKDGVLHDYRIDRGRVRAVAPGALSLLERDGTLVTIPVAPNAAVTLNGRRVALASLRRNMTATTPRHGDSAATMVEATGSAGGRANGKRRRRPARSEPRAESTRARRSGRPSSWSRTTPASASSSAATSSATATASSGCAPARTR